MSNTHFLCVCVCVLLFDHHHHQTTIFNKFLNASVCTSSSVLPKKRAHFDTKCSSFLLAFLLVLHSYLLARKKEYYLDTYTRIVHAQMLKSHVKLHLCHVFSIMQTSVNSNICLLNCEGMVHLNSVRMQYYWNVSWRSRGVVILIIFRGNTPNFLI